MENESLSDPHAPSLVGYQILTTKWEHIPVTVKTAFTPPPPERLASEATQGQYHGCLARYSRRSFEDRAADAGGMPC